jgi:hypothetical protein
MVPPRNDSNPTAPACRLWRAARPSGAGLALGPPAVQASPALRVDHSNSKLVQLVISDLQIVPLLFLQKSDQCIFAGAVIKDGISSRSVIRQNGVC